MLKHKAKRQALMSGLYNDKGKIVYKVSFGTEGDKEVDVRIDAMNGTLLSVKFDD